MPAPHSWPPPNSVIFVTALCLMALIGEVIATAYPGLGNPTKIAFYSFLPVALWMMTIEQRQCRSTDRTHADHHERAINGSELRATVGHLRVSHFRHLACYQGVGTKGRT